MTKSGEAPGKSWAQNGGNSDPLTRAEFFRDRPPQRPLTGPAGPDGSVQSGIRLGVYVDALAGVLGGCIINLPADARPGAVDWIDGIIDETLDYGIVLSAPPEGSA